MRKTNPFLMNLKKSIIWGGIRYFNMSLEIDILKYNLKFKKSYILIIMMMNQKHLNVNDINTDITTDITIIYQTKTQYWGISSNGTKRRIPKKKFESLLKIKKLISYQDSKIFQKDIGFTIFGNQVEIKVNESKQYIQIFNQTSLKFTFIDIFSGAGGLSQGLIEAGLTPELCIDDNIDSCQTLRKNHPNIPVIHTKIEKFNFSKFQNQVDVLVGGAPCQSFSYAGLKKGLLDSNGSALLEFIQTIFVICPKIFVIENVKGLLSHEKGKTFQHIMNLLSKDQIYNLEFELIDMVDYGIPQKRVRLFIIGSLKSANLPKFFPLPKSYKGSKKQVLGNVLRKVPASAGIQYSPLKQKLFQKIPPGGCWINLPIEEQKNYLGKTFFSGGGKRGILRRLSMSEPSLTLLCSPLCSPSQKQTERCHPLEERPLTIREYVENMHVYKHFQMIIIFVEV